VFTVAGAGAQTGKQKNKKKRGHSGPKQKNVGENGKSGAWGTDGPHPAAP